VVWAIAEGRKAAACVDAYLSSSDRLSVKAELGRTREVAS